jgi:hypothetical protein
MANPPGKRAVFNTADIAAQPEAARHFVSASADATPRRDPKLGSFRNFHFFAAAPGT